MDTAEETKRQRKAKQDRRWRDANKEHVAKTVKAYQQSHKSQVNATNKQWQLRNRKEHLKSHRKAQRDYYSKHREYYRTKAKERRALRRKAVVNLAGILNFMERVKEKSLSICYYCEGKVHSDKIHFDHIVPLSKGGAHSVENLCVSCADCNQSKYDKPIQAWVRIGQQILSL